MALFSAAGGREGWMGPSPKVGTYCLRWTDNPCTRLERDRHGSSFDWIWRAVSGHVVSLGRPKFASRVESHSCDPIRITEIFARGVVNGVSPSSEPVPSTKSVSRLSRIQHPQTGFYEPVLRLLQHEAATGCRVMRKGKERSLHLSWRATWASWRHENGASAPVFTCQAETSDILTGG